MSKSKPSHLILDSASVLPAKVLTSHLNVIRLVSKLDANEKCDKEMHEVKSELIKVIVYTMMHNR